MPVIAETFLIFCLRTKFGAQSTAKISKAKIKKLATIAICMPEMDKICESPDLLIAVLSSFVRLVLLPVIRASIIEAVSESSIVALISLVILYLIFVRRVSILLILSWSGVLEISSFTCPIALKP